MDELETLEERGLYRVPAGDGKSAPVVVDFKSVALAQSRLIEVATVNLHTAPELLNFYSRSWARLERIVQQLTYQRNLAEAALDEARAVALLEADDKLTARGAKRATQELRDAIVTLDPEVKKVRARYEEIRTVLERIRVLSKEFENAYNSVKKMVGAQQLPTLGPKAFGNAEIREQSRTVSTKSGGDLPPGMEEG